MAIIVTKIITLFSIIHGLKDGCYENFPLLNFHRFQPLLENDMEYTRGSPTLPSGTEVFHEELVKTLLSQNPPNKHKI